jgi:hypothetical protein
MSKTKPPQHILPKRITRDGNNVTIHYLHTKLVVTDLPQQWLQHVPALNECTTLHNKLFRKLGSQWGIMMTKRGTRYIHHQRTPLMMDGKLLTPKKGATYRLSQDQLTPINTTSGQLRYYQIELID